MIACVSPAAADAAESLATLRFAARARAVGFARVCGDPAAPLILYVHGSGPTNSSNWWSHVAPELARLAADDGGAGGAASDWARASQYLHVAIDCPGYGRSPGDKQTVRSYPAALIGAVLAALGRRSACLLVGSSQGAAAVLNAALERPTLAPLVAVCHPVTHVPPPRLKPAARSLHPARAARGRPRPRPRPRPRLRPRLRPHP